MPPIVWHANALPGNRELWPVVDPHEHDQTNEALLRWPFVQPEPDDREELDFEAAA
jgi:hypothetical protein